jgi:hypothetical protein
VMGSFLLKLSVLQERGAGEGIRTPDRLITNQVLYQLSYASPSSTLHRRKHLRA